MKKMGSLSILLLLALFITTFLITSVDALVCRDANGGAKPRGPNIFEQAHVEYCEGPLCFTPDTTASDKCETPSLVRENWCSGFFGRTHTSEIYFCDDGYRCDENEGKCTECLSRRGGIFIVGDKSFSCASNSDLGTQFCTRDGRALKCIDNGKSCFGWEELNNCAASNQICAFTETHGAQCENCPALSCNGRTGIISNECGQSINCGVGAGVPTEQITVTSATCIDNRISITWNKITRPSLPNYVTRATMKWKENTPGQQGCSPNERTTSGPKVDGKTLLYCLQEKIPERLDEMFLSEVILRENSCPSGYTSTSANTINGKNIVTCHRTLPINAGATTKIVASVRTINTRFAANCNSDETNPSGSTFTDRDGNLHKLCVKKEFISFPYVVHFPINIPGGIPSRIAGAVLQPSGSTVTFNFNDYIAHLNNNQFSFFIDINNDRASDIGGTQVIACSSSGSIGGGTPTTNPCDSVSCVNQCTTTADGKPATQEYICQNNNGVGECVASGEPQACTTGQTCNPETRTCETVSNTPECGNGNEESGEECDDGTASNGACPDRCSASCTLNSCGNSVGDSGPSTCRDVTRVVTGGIEIEQSSDYIKVSNCESIQDITSYPTGHSEFSSLAEYKEWICNSCTNTLALQSPNGLKCQWDNTKCNLITQNPGNGILCSQTFSGGECTPASTESKGTLTVKKLSGEENDVCRACEDAGVSQITDGGCEIIDHEILCPQRIELPFFTLFNLFFSLVLITGIYALLAKAQKIKTNY